MWSRHYRSDTCTALKQSEASSGLFSHRQISIYPVCWLSRINLNRSCHCEKTGQKRWVNLKPIVTRKKVTRGTSWTELSGWEVKMGPQTRLLRTKRDITAPFGVYKYSDRSQRRRHQKTRKSIKRTTCNFLLSLLGHLSDFLFFSWISDF